ncbi:MAG: SDR family NAD(P)-dependent oxidoreductase, partial [Solirubrobacteraceae bacterium]|nr:SDR family NAD(P)-dependent oxidoreductase [Solirubrobacteraceae bacterium]
GMGGRLLDDEPAFAATIDELEPLVAAEAGFSLRAALRDGGKLGTVDQTQVAVFGVQVALAALWRTHGREPAAVIGHSMGEVAAAVAVGSLTLAEGVRLSALRARLLQGINDIGVGAMAVLNISADELSERSGEYPDVDVAVFAAPRQCAVTGDADQVRRLAADVEALGRDAWVLKVTGAAHSAAVDPILDELVAGLAELRPRSPEVPVYSTVLEDPRATPSFDAPYWRANVRRPVRFTHAVAAAAEDGFTSFVEVSPHPVAAAAVRQTIAERGVPDGTVTPTLRRNTDDTVTFRAQALALAAREADATLGWSAPHGQQVDLPLPAWQRQRFWVDRAPAAAPVAGHPLLGARIDVPEGGRHLWRSDLGVDRLPWMADHAVHGVPVLPGAGFAEIALGAASEVLGGDPGALVVRGLELDRVLPLGAQTDVTTSVRLSDAGDARVEIYAGSPMVRHATAAVSRDPLPTDGWATVPGDPGESIDLYAAFRAAGHRYGPAFTGVEDARLHAGGVATARVRLPEAASADPRFRVHPALLDVCLQTLGVAAQAHLDDHPMELYLPLGIGALQVAADPHEGGRCVATLRPLDDDGAGLTGTIQLIADDGRVLLRADDVYLRRLSRDAVPAPLEDKLFEAAWQSAASPAPTDDASGRWLLLAGEASAHAVPVEQLARELRAAGHRIEFGQHGTEHEVAEAVAGLAARDDRPPLGVVLVTPTLDPSDVGSDAALELAERLVVAVARVGRVIGDTAFDAPVRLWILTRAGLHPAMAALRAAVRVLAFEHPALQATLVDVDPQTTDETALAAAVTELRGGAADDEISWPAEGRRVRRLARVTLTEASEPPPSAIRDGAYIVTGGLGGLGLVVARWLAAGGATRIVLSGRSAPSPEAQHVIDELRDDGVEVQVVRGDIARPATAPALVDTATAGDIPLRGVVHAAGVLEDEVVARVTPGAVERVWAPKVTGGWNLHAATQGHDLDLWLVFSSAAALLGSPGQLAYATANAWLDALVAWRREAGLPATTIEWGAWSEVGGVATTTNVLLEPLSPAEGLEALEAVLRSGRTATGVVRLDPQRAIELMPGLATLAFFADLLERELPAADNGTDWPGLAALRAAEPGAARAILADRLLERVATIMAYRPEQIDVHAPLTSLGADSLIAVRAKNAVEHDFEVALPVRLLLQDASLADIEAHIAGELGLAGDDASRQSVSPGVERYVEPRDTTERWLAGVWEDVLGRRPIGVTEVLAPTQDRAAAEQVLLQLRGRLGDDLDAAALLADGVTIEAQADLVRDRLEGHDGTPVRTLREGADDEAPLFLFHPAGGTTAVYQPLADLLPPGAAVIGFERIDHLDTIEAKAAFYLETIRSLQPEGPYRLGGWSLGGCLAYDAARQLHAAGEEVEFVAMIDTILPDHALGGDEHDALHGRFVRFAEYLETTYEVRLDLDVDQLMALPEDEQITAFMEAVTTSGLGMSASVLEHQRTSYVDARIAERYRPSAYDGRVLLYRATDRGLTTTLDPRYARQEDSLGWDVLCRHLEVVRVTGDHTQLIDRPNVDIIAEHLGLVLGATHRFRRDRLAPVRVRRAS